MFTPDAVASGPALAIEVDGLTKRFQGRPAIENVALTVKRSALCALAGANGGGKSTLMRLLSGLLIPDEGKGTVLGCDLLRDRHLIRRKVGYLAQRCTLYPTLTVGENLRFRASIFGLPSPAQVATEQIREFGLSDFTNVTVDRLSGGWSRLAQLAATLIHRPKLLLLDEPTVGLDHAARHAIWQTLTSLAKDGTAVVLSTHDSTEAARCSEILLLSQGRLCARP